MAKKPSKETFVSRLLAVIQRALSGVPEAGERATRWGQRTTQSAVWFALNVAALAAVVIDAYFTGCFVGETATGWPTALAFLVGALVVAAAVLLFTLVLDKTLPVARHLLWFPAAALFVVSLTFSAAAMTGEHLRENLRMHVQGVRTQAKREAAQQTSRSEAVRLRARTEANARCVAEIRREVGRELTRRTALCDAQKRGVNREAYGARAGKGPRYKLKLSNLEDCRAKERALRETLQGTDNDCDAFCVKASLVVTEFDCPGLGATMEPNSAPEVEAESMSLAAVGELTTVGVITSFRPFASSPTAPSVGLDFWFNVVLALVLELFSAFGLSMIWRFPGNPLRPNSLDSDVEAEVVAGLGEGSPASSESANGDHAPPLRSRPELSDELLVIKRMLLGDHAADKEHGRRRLQELVKKTARLRRSDPLDRHLGGIEFEARLLNVHEQAHAGHAGSVHAGLVQLEAEIDQREIALPLQIEYWNRRLISDADRLGEVAKTIKRLEALIRKVNTPSTDEERQIIGQAHGTIAMVYTLRGPAKRALKHQARARELLGDEARRFVWLALALGRLGRFKEANVALAHGQKAWAASGEASSSQSSHFLAWARAEVAAHQDQLEGVQEAWSAIREVPFFARELARAHYVRQLARAGEYGRALECWREGCEYVRGQTGAQTGDLICLVYAGAVAHGGLALIDHGVTRTKIGHELRPLLRGRFDRRSGVFPDDVYDDITAVKKKAPKTADLKGFTLLTGYIPKMSSDSEEDP